MADPHWKDDDFIDRLFGIGPEGDHLATCALCARRWQSFQLKQEQRISGLVEVPDALLAEQRRAVYTRLGEKKPAFRLEVAPTMAAIVLLLVILSALRPVPDQQRPETMSDTQMFEEIFDMASSNEPDVVEPVRSLFEVRQ